MASYGRHIQMLLGTVGFMYLALTSHFLLSSSYYKIKTSESRGPSNDLSHRGLDLLASQRQADVRLTNCNSTDVMTRMSAVSTKSNFTDNLGELSLPSHSNISAVSGNLQYTALHSSARQAPSLDHPKSQTYLQEQRLLDGSTVRETFKDNSKEWKTSFEGSKSFPILHNISNLQTSLFHRSTSWSVPTKGGFIYRSALARSQPETNSVLKDRGTHNSTLRGQAVFLIGEYKLKIVINQDDMCDTGPDTLVSPHLLVQVHSHCGNKAQRDSVRATWGHLTTSGPRVTLVFLLGKCNDTLANSKVTHEATLYRDIVQWDFIDSYSNLTIKSLAGLIWARSYCSNAQYLLKADDDLYVNISGVLSLTQHTVAPLMGYVYHSAKPHRQGLWRVSQLQYPEEVYPPYCSGTAYLMANGTADSLLEAFANVKPPLIPIEDIYITGILARQSKLACEHRSMFPSWASMPSFNTLLSLLNGSLLGIHGVTFERMHHIHHVIRNCSNCYNNKSEVRKWFEWIKSQKVYG